ncbi:flavin-containing monooxygenase [Pseudonocardia hydrocarbonoxydans]|uniref:Monooxygenase n=1 Tax=Pseudonocardia hydrocarbonoxydans TaxID=76726 RepID=A0A4Y3WR90_9PSEU|nr:NAD(P)-binding domain-containing protein [Pseudonocardia hydrocarbonoxydans]GEC21407.1 monooxygenase [Pseudonocardia hydrocarbonoxydans]
MTVTVDAVVVGGGQAGLAVGRELQRRGRSFVVLDRETEVGAVWRRRWDSLRLFTPAGFTHLPGLELDAPPDSSPTKDEMADHLVAYVRRFALPVESATTVAAVDRDGERLRVTAVDGRGWRARDVVLATGSHGRPDVPGFAADLDPAIARLHSRDYRRPAQLPDGAVLVVGAGNSGAEIAVDLARAGREVWLSGRDVGHMPRLGSRTYPILRALGRPGAVLARRRLRGGGDPLGRIRPGDLESAGVRRVPRTLGARDGLPVFDGGSTARVAAVVWCTGLRPDHGFVALPVHGADGRLLHRRGITTVPGLYAVGQPYQSSITSHLVGGVGTDARHVVDHLVRRDIR